MDQARRSSWDNSVSLSSRQSVRWEGGSRKGGVDGEREQGKGRASVDERVQGIVLEGHSFVPPSMLIGAWLTAILAGEDDLIVPLCSPCAGDLIVAQPRPSGGRQAPKGRPLSCAIHKPPRRPSQLSRPAVDRINGQGQEIPNSGSCV